MTRRAVQQRVESPEVGPRAALPAPWRMALRRGAAAIRLLAGLLEQERSRWILNVASITTAASRTPPVIMNLTDDSSPSRSMPLAIEPMTSAPSSASQTEPRPPKRLVPAITGPAIDSSSRSLPPDAWLTASRREAAMMPPNAASVEHSTNTSMRMRLTLTPERRANARLSASRSTPPSPESALCSVERLVVNTAVTAGAVSIQPVAKVTRPSVIERFKGWLPKKKKRPGSGIPARKVIQVLVWVRRFAQFGFFALFFYLLAQTAFRGTFAANSDEPVRLPLPVEAFLLADPFR